MSQPPAPQPIFDILHADIAFLLLGLYGWEYILSFNVEYAVICGRSSFRAPLVPYIVGRISLLCYLILVVIRSGPFPMPQSVCKPAILLSSLFGIIAIGCASTIFMIRSWLIWKDSVLVHVLQVFLALAQWALLIFNLADLRFLYVDGSCEPIIEYPKVTAASLIYTMCFDFVIFVLSVVGLARQQSRSPLKKRLYTQGVLYFAVGGIAYIPPVVFVMRNDPDYTSLLRIFSHLAVTASTIVASRSVRSLLFLNASLSSEIGESNMALTTQILMGTSTMRESTYV